MHNKVREGKEERKEKHSHLLNYKFNEFVAEDDIGFKENDRDNLGVKNVEFNKHKDSSNNNYYQDYQKSFSQETNRFDSTQTQEGYYNPQTPVYEIEELKEVVYYKNRREIESLVRGFKKEDIETVFSIKEGNAGIINISNIELEHKRVGLASGYYCNQGLFWGKNLRSLFVNILLSVEVLMNQYPQDSTGNYPYPNTENWGYVNNSLYYLAYQGNLNKYYDDFIKLIENQPLLSERIEENVDQFGNKIKGVGETTGEVVGKTTKGVKGIAERIWRGDPNKKQYMSNSDSSFIGLFVLIAILYYFFR